jgi:hydroxymethylglutaryl-CoA lyase
MKEILMQRDTSGGKLLIEDEALRDGLQMESRLFNLEEKLTFFNLLKSSGLKRIQVGSFVHPKIVPQMADTGELIQAIPETDRHLATALILNEKGLERALQSGVGHVSMSVSVSDTHSRKNARRSASDALSAMTGLIRLALTSGLEVRAGLQCAFGCAYEGAVAEKAVVEAAEKMVQTGIKEINLADSTGMATPLAVRSLVGKMYDAFPDIRISLHLHDTRGLALLNMFAGYESGVRIFDTCAGGLGGCPFIKRAAGNIPTEDAVHMFEAMGISTGLDIETLCKAVIYLEEKLGRRLPGRMKHVLGYERTCE